MNSSLFTTLHFVGRRKGRLRLCSLILSVLLLLSAVTGCAHKNHDQEQNAGPQILEHVFRGKEAPLPDGWELNPSVVPRWDAETGRLTCCAFHSEIIEGADGSLRGSYQTSIFTFSSDGAAEEWKVPVPGDAYLSSGILTDDGFFFMMNWTDSGTGETSVILYRYTFADEKMTVSDDLAVQFALAERGWVYVDFFCADGDGDIYLGTDREVLILSPDFIEKTIVTASGMIRSMASSSDGSVYIVTGSGFARIDKESGTLGTTRALPQNVQNIYFAPGYDLYYSTDGGVFGVNYGEDGSMESEIVCDFLNSDLNRANSDLLAVYDADTMAFMISYDMNTWTSKLVLFRHAEDIDLSSIRTVTAAVFLNRAETSVLRRIAEFNRAHDDIRIVVVDYGQYATEDNPIAGEQRLALDMTTGIFKPDIVYGTFNCEAIRVLRDKKLYRDFMPFLEKDELINTDNLFGAIRHAFDNGEGGMWGIARTFELDTLVSTKTLLGPYADRGYWNISELLDYAENLPDDVSLMGPFWRENAESVLLGSTGYGSFIDTANASCSFDSPEFLRWLRFLAAVPTLNEYKQSSPYARADNNEKYLPYFEGKIALRQFRIMSFTDLPEFEIQFNTKEYDVIGYPVSEVRRGAGTRVIPLGTFVVTSFCEDPDAVWETIRFLFTGENLLTEGLPAMKQDYDRLARTFIDERIEQAVYFRGGGHSRPGDPENPTKPEDMNYPGIVFYLTEEKAAEYKKLLDEAGTSVTETVDSEVSGIIHEEISAFLGEACTAEECASRIQSRVSIWLAEHQ